MHPNTTFPTNSSVWQDTGNSSLVTVDLMMPSSVTLCFVTTLIMALSVVVVFLYYFQVGNRYTLDTHTSSVLLFLGGLLSTITAVGTATNPKVVEVYRIYILGLTCLIGLFFTVTGSICFFQSGRSLTREQLQKAKAVGHQHGNLGIVIWIVTLPLVLLELLIIIGVLRTESKIFYVSARITTTTEKLIQASVYYFSIRHRYPNQSCIPAAQWFFQILSLYNFILWVDSIVTTSDDDALLCRLYGSGFSILKSAYNALIIDYRMLCALLFLEHGLEIGHIVVQKGDKENEHDKKMVPDIEASHDLPEKGSVISVPFSMENRVSHYSGAGYLVGIIVIMLQILNGLQYLQFTGPWANISGITADLLVIICGIVFLRLNSLDADVRGQWRESDSKGIDAMVGIMGGVGFTFWIIKSFMSSVLAAHYAGNPKYKYLLWTSVKNCVRATGVLFQLYVFTRTSPAVCTRSRNRKILINHFLVPVLMLSLFAVFVTAIVDQYHGDVEVLLHHAVIDDAVRFLLEAGDPIHLAFCLHMFLHFLIVRYKMVNVKVRVTYMMEETSVIEHDGYSIVEGRQSSLRRELTTPLLGDADTGPAETQGKVD